MILRTSSKERLLPRTIWEWLIIPFVIGSMTISFNSGLSGAVIIYGFVFSLMFVVYYFFVRRKVTVPPEVVIYFAWVVWAMIGSVNAINPDYYLTYLFTVLQIGLMIFLVSSVVAISKNISSIMIGVILGGLVILLYSYFTDEILVAGDMSLRTRATSITGNANSLAYQLLFVVFAILLVWRNSYSRLLKAILSTMLALAIMGIIFSASRKGFLGLVLFSILWLYFCRFQQASKRTSRTLLVTVIIIGANIVGYNYLIYNTYLGDRLLELKEGKGLDSRTEFYKIGLRIIEKNPLFGAGLNQFRKYTATNTYSHSDYIEVAANTGIVGFLIYFSVYLVLWLRVKRIRNLFRDMGTHNTTGLIKAAIITILVVAFGRPNITSKITWIFLAGVIGYTWSMERDYNKTIGSSARINTSGQRQQKDVRGPRLV